MPKFLLVGAFLAIAACSTPAPVDRPDPGYRPPPPPPPPVENPDPVDPDPVEPRFTGLIPPHMEGREIVRAALLLPFSADNAGARAEALYLLNAAQLALFEHGNGDLVLMPKDTGGTASGARQATNAAISDGADIILGPLFGAAARAAGEAASPYQIPVIAFSTDGSVAGGGVYLLSFPPEAEVARVVEYATRSGISSFAYLGPTGAYGNIVRDAMETESRMSGGSLVASEPYSGGVEAMTSAAGRLARSGTGYQAVMMPEGGVRLRMLGPLLPYHDVDPAEVQFMGTGLWNDPETIREPVLRGGWFAGPDEAAHGRFVTAYEAAYGDAPSRIASHAYDAVLLTMHLADGRAGFTRQTVETPDGFLGADGLFRFRADGRIERGLAVYQVTGSGFRVIEPAPRSFEPQGF
tara:strand:+ start:1234 stop:2460 length:1227 start_codon:yes stop_codon:yes gene_type:complete